MYTPLDFPLEYNHQGIVIKFLDVVEMGQSGIKLGRLSIDGYKINHLDFGGPLFILGENIFVPIYKRNFFKSGFLLGVINLKTYKVFTMGKIKSLIWIYLIKDNYIYIYEDISMNIKSCYHLSELKEII